jgi:hypothetical protein
MKVDEINRRILVAGIKRTSGAEKADVEGMHAYVRFPGDEFVTRFEITGKTREMLDAGEQLEPGHQVTLSPPRQPLAA